MLDYLSHRALSRSLRKATAKDEWSKLVEDIERHDEDCRRFAELNDVDNVRIAWDQQYREMLRMSNLARNMRDRL